MSKSDTNAAVNNREYTTDITELKVKDFFSFQKALLTLTIGEGYGSLEEIIIKTLTLLAKNRVNDAHQELVSVLTVINNIEGEESSVVDGLKALLKSGDIDNARYKDLLLEFESVRRWSSTVPRAVPLRGRRSSRRR